MAKGKKNPWEQLSDAEKKEAAKKATEKAKGGGGQKEDEPATRKMVRVNEDAHAMAKTVAGMLGIPMQEYIEKLISEDTRKRFPEIHKRIVGGG